MTLRFNAKVPKWRKVYKFFLISLFLTIINSCFYFFIFAMNV